MRVPELGASLIYTVLKCIGYPRQIKSKSKFGKNNYSAPAVLVNDVLHGHPVRPGRRRVLRARLAVASAAAAHPRRDGVASVDGVVGRYGVVAEKVRRTLSRCVELGLRVLDSVNKLKLHIPWMYIQGGHAPQMDLG